MNFSVNLLINNIIRQDLKSLGCKAVRVQVPPRAPYFCRRKSNKIKAICSNVVTAQGRFFCACYLADTATATSV